MKPGTLIAAGDRLEWVDDKGQPQSQVAIRDVRVKHDKTIVQCEYTQIAAARISRHKRISRRFLGGGLPTLGARR